MLLANHGASPSIVAMLTWPSLAPSNAMFYLFPAGVMRSLSRYKDGRNELAGERRGRMKKSPSQKWGLHWWEVESSQPQVTIGKVQGRSLGS